MLIAIWMLLVALQIALPLVFFHYFGAFSKEIREWNGVTGAQPPPAGRRRLSQRRSQAGCPAFGAIAPSRVARGPPAVAPHMTLCCACQRPHNVRALVGWWLLVVVRVHGAKATSGMPLGSFRP